MQLVLSAQCESEFHDLNHRFLTVSTITETPVCCYLTGVAQPQVYKSVLLCHLSSTWSRFSILFQISLCVRVFPIRQTNATQFCHSLENVLFYAEATCRLHGETLTHQVLAARVSMGLVQ